MKRKFMILASIFVAAGLFASGCSDKQDEADEIERQMMETPETLTTVDTVQPETEPVDTMQQPDVSAVPEEEPALPDLPGEPAGSGFVVQVAACESADYARYLIDKYTGRGYEPWVTEVMHDGQQYYRVRVGPYETLEKAREMKLELEDRYSIKAWIDPY